MSIGDCGVLETDGAASMCNTSGCPNDTQEAMQDSGKLCRVVELMSVQLSVLRQHGGKDTKV